MPVAGRITVEAAGYDLFTFQGVPTTRLDVPLPPAAPGPASSVGVANSVGQALSSAFIDNVLADSRVLLAALDRVEDAGHMHQNRHRSEHG